MFVAEANHIYIAMPIYNLIDYSDNYSETSGSLWHFKRDKDPANNADLSIDNSEYFKYKAALVGKITNHNNGNSFVKNTKLVVPLKYLSNFWRPLEKSLINSKVHLELNWIEDCILSNAGDSAKFEITDAKLHVPVVTLPTKDSVNLTKQLSKWFQRPAYWKNYQAMYAKVIKKEKTYMNYLIHHCKVLEDYLFLLILLLQVVMLMKKQA